MSTAAVTDVVKFHISLNASELGRSIAFYRTLFGLEPAKVRDDYAKFELAEPPVILSLIPIPPTAGGNMNHVGLRVLDSAALVEMQMRLEQAGYKTQTEEGVECCYSKQTKFWVNDPDGCLWELYVLHGDADEHDDHGPSATHGLVGNSTFRGKVQSDEAGCCGGASELKVSIGPSVAAAAEVRNASAVYSHLLTQPLPERIDAADGTFTEAQLQGTLNMQADRARIVGFLRETFRVLQPGGSVLVHALTSDRAFTDRPQLPGPAALVEQVWTDTEAAAMLSEAGFVGVQFAKLGARPCFTVDDTAMRETKLTGLRPAAECSEGSKVPVLYKGPLAELRDDFGNTYRRGVRVAVPSSVAAWLASSPLAASFFIPEESAGGGCCGS
ncbi:MAG: VOC family protein [Planctomycetes bacterium]|nr:VOC family protein [Planctomycetota bacterium]